MAEDNFQIIDLFDEGYINTTLSSRLYDLFAKKAELIVAYIKPDREFWYYDSSIGYRKLRVTYVRAGVMFFVFEDEPEKEHAWFISSFNCMMLYAAQIYPYEIGNLLEACWEGAKEDVLRMSKQCKWDDCNGNITVRVFWDTYNK